MSAAGGRKDPVVSQRLQLAASQLQAAIQSARKRRQSAILEREGGVLSSNSSSSGGSSSGSCSPSTSSIKHDSLILHRTVLGLQMSDDSAHTEKENDSVDSANACGLEEMVQEWPSGDRASVTTSQSSVSPLLSPQSDVFEVVCKPSLAPNSTGLLQCENGGETPIERVTCQALTWVQRDVERQAKDNRVVQGILAQAIHDITDVIGDMVSPDTESRLQNAAAAATGTGSNDEATERNVPVHLDPNRVDELVGQWEDALVTWREQCVVEKQELVEGFACFEEECLSRMSFGEESRRREQERAARKANEQQMLTEDHANHLLRGLEASHVAITRLEMQLEDLSSQLMAVAMPSVFPKQQPLMVCTATQSEEGPRQELLDLAAQTKASELHALRCEMALTEQTELVSETDARLQMLLEDWRSREQIHITGIPAESNGALDAYQQKLRLLEGRMQDIQQQVSCDHEQFEYEQAKWSLEKRQQRAKYDEVLDASVKVLKVLLIREKLLKKHERARQKRDGEAQQQQMELERQVAALQATAQELMQEGAVVLLVLQQLAVLKRSNDSNTPAASKNWTLPAKPVQMKRMLKRLKKIETELGQRGWATPLPSAASSSPATGV